MLAQITQVGRVLVPLAGPKAVSAPVAADPGDDVAGLGGERPDLVG